MLMTNMKVPIDMDYEIRYFTFFGKLPIDEKISTPLSNDRGGIEAPEFPINAWKVEANLGSFGEHRCFVQGGDAVSVWNRVFLNWEDAVQKSFEMFDEKVEERDWMVDGLMVDGFGGVAYEKGKGGSMIWILSNEDLHKLLCCSIKQVNVCDAAGLAEVIGGTAK